MSDATQRKQKVIMDLEMLNLTNELGCSACGRKFSLGDSAVFAYGGWGEEQRYIHENEAVWNPHIGQFVERKHNQGW
jgi:hypothetical protein